jgi:uncharacterized membrane protein
MARQRLTFGTRALLLAVALMVLLWLTTHDGQLVGTILAAVVVVWLFYRVVLGGRRR